MAHSTDAVALSPQLSMKRSQFACLRNISIPIHIPPQIDLGMTRTGRKRYACSSCGQMGHNVSRCPAIHGPQPISKYFKKQLKEGLIEFTE